MGAGSLAKLANQLIVSSNICAVAEALLLAERGGANPVRVSEALLSQPMPRRCPMVLMTWP
ncbi:NAD-binding protein [Mesorhizobium tamadayense]|uniref:NAD-binding protein n=1 Tax=Mesorhizobium tamadayense TaxID=425306 RepID=UPI003CCACD7D